MSELEDLSRAQIQEWLEGYHRSSATLDATKWCSEYMTDDTELQYANNPVTKGQEVRDMFAQVFLQLDLMEHEIVYFDYVAPRIYQAARIRYRVKGDMSEQEIVIQGFATFYLQEDEDKVLKCSRAEVYLDPSPLFARIAEKANVDA
ncbi:hypothetical protein EDD37DRAFT_653413 [Exophiala viscosa]|uniref:uncharacterized protein n=1 Tax=Exophiala viscosa TaxID=2486360 RepID=UPI002193BD45|nr:hypothetical protein EDD37DRAFT_653413 [Exophiala viscosa]